MPTYEVRVETKNEDIYVIMIDSNLLTPLALLQSCIEEEGIIINNKNPLFIPHSNIKTVSAKKIERVM